MEKPEDIMMNLAKSMNDSNNTYQELCRWITSTLEQSGYNKLELGADIMKHLLKQLDSSKFNLFTSTLDKIRDDHRNCWPNRFW